MPDTVNFRGEVDAKRTETSSPTWKPPASAAFWSIAMSSAEIGFVPFFRW
ncbi:MAG: hypothetical protein ACHQIG_09550 [Acidimicrobiia bacterium]